MRVSYEVQYERAPQHAWERASGKFPGRIITGYRLVIDDRYVGDYPTQEAMEAAIETVRLEKKPKSLEENIAAMIQKAVEEERQACALVCRKLGIAALGKPHTANPALDCERAILMRGPKPR